MRALRDALGGLAFVAVTACTVLGSIFLAMSETGQTLAGPTAPSTSAAPATAEAGSPAPSPTRIPTQTPTASDTPAPTPTASETPAPPPTPVSPTAPAVEVTPTDIPPTATDVAVACGPPPGWVPYTVQRGDTLFKLSQRYRQTVQAIQQANCLQGEAIFYGQTLFLPPIRFETAAPLPSDTPAPTATATPVPAPLRITNVALAGVIRDASRPNGAVALVRIEFGGGAAPYTFFHDGIQQPGNPVRALTECGGTLIHTVRVDSADGQTASRTYYFSPVACPP